MSYFPTDIHFMSDDELIKNGLKKPYKKPEIIDSKDLVPVVRCRDCKHDISSQFDTEARCNLWGCLKPKRGFCDAGKRKEPYTEPRS